MNLKNIFILILFCSFGPILSGQNDNQAENERIRNLPFRKRLTYFMGGGINFGNNYSSISLQPQVGYKVNAKFTAGVGINYQYTNYNSNKYQIYGGNLFARYMITNNLFAQTQYERLNYGYAPHNSWNDYLLLGGGYFSGQGFYISGYYLVLYPVNNNIYSRPYILRVGFMF